MATIGFRFGLNKLISTIEERIRGVDQQISDQISKLCEYFGDEGHCQELEKATKARLAVRELITVARRVVKRNILERFGQRSNASAFEKAELCLWWYRFRNQIRLGIVQYYREVNAKFKKWNTQIDTRLSFLNDALAILDSNWHSLTIETCAIDAERLSFDPFSELKQEMLDVLMHKPSGDEVPVRVISERFSAPLHIGSVGQALGIDHRAVKVYDIEFHFCANEGIIIGDKFRSRVDPERGIKVNLIGWTKKSQWEVQRIYDQLNDFCIEDGQFKEGQFSSTKYAFLENNCIHFTKAFVEKLLEDDDETISKKWPPALLRQPSINRKSCHFLAKCFSTSSVPDSDDERRK